MTIPDPNLQRPRLIASTDTWSQCRARRKSEPRYDALLRQIENYSLALLDVEPASYIKVGRRLLAVSRLVLKRVLALSLTYCVTGKKEFLRRAEAEMMAAASFPDWNPSHFLDTAEMMAGLAFGYDWLHADLDTTSRDAIREALIHKGLEQVWAGGKPHGFVNSTNNWNQVCFAGSVVASLAVWEEAPELARRTVALVPEGNRHGQHPYAPAGVYPEGPMYWAYGTSFEVVLLSALRRAFDTDFGLAASPGFLQTAMVQLQETAPSGDWFNFSDCSLRGGLEPAQFWFARELNQPELLRFQLKKLDAWTSPQRPADSKDGESRLVPLLALWWPESLDPKSDLPLAYYGEGENPIVVIRSSWEDPEATYLAFKGGRANLSHAHMDAGSFIFESQGVRWAHDLGMQDYHGLESIGVNLWDRKQDGVGWGVFRLSPFSHNTLTIDGKRHNVAGHALVTAHDFSAEAQTATVDLTPVLAGQATSARRTFWQNGDSTRILDHLTGVSPGASVRWAMVTKAQIQLEGPVALLKQQGRELWVGFDCEAQFEVTSIPATGPHPYDAANPGFSILTATVTAPASGIVDLRATLGPTKPTPKNE